MKGVMRPPRGRPSKVAKISAPTRRPGRGHVVSPGKAGQFDESGMVDEMNAAAAAAAAAAVAVAAEMDDGEADGQMEEDGGDDDAVAAASAGLAHTENVDLNTAANILTNGSVGSSSGVMALQEQHGVHAHQPPAPMGGPQHLGPGDHGHAHNMDPSFVKTTEELSRESGYESLNIDSGLAKRLAREPGLRIAQQRRPEQQLNLARRSNVEALFAHIAGDLAPTPCKNCHKGHGPWNTCVVVDGQMCGSCANCWFNASGARCSFHETRNPQAVHHPSSLLAGGSGGSPQDHSASFAMSQQLPLPSAPAHNSLAASLNLGGPMSNDPVVRYTIDRAIADLRAADRKTRQIMMIEIAAKQLALQILEYEESVAAEQQQQQQQQQPGPPQGQQDLGGDGV
ncbi:hypothetical protein QBC33DRAFT_489818 [Phialemonium atrogriseum]|uniref:Uncharacterized protein n=1 Tax=Phialemonium atrogriseum TaxID=1093897 RepID=A0AAJ0C2X7_9PEZI|nr:uncharacterized protein QBC33DRAFT_489818 [Phialemonium atrogriseum]KAK1768527.1 hypothetical protein QBC33DRAFT_489818 [Phialemonium atrogriseum]